MKRLERLLGVALLLSARRRLRAQDLAEHFDVTLRTIYRDVRALEQAGFPVTGTAGDGYVLPASAQLRPLAFDPLEAESLMLAARLLEKSADEPVSARLRGAMAKLEAALTSEARRRVRDHRRSVLLPGERRKSAGPLALILEAVTDRLVLDLTYAGIARGEVTRREIEPLGAVWFSKLWLIPAW